MTVSAAGGGDSCTFDDALRVRMSGCIVRYDRQFLRPIFAAQELTSERFPARIPIAPAEAPPAAPNVTTPTSPTPPRASESDLVAGSTTPSTLNLIVGS